MNKTIKINDKEFRKYIDAEQIKECVNAISLAIVKRHKEQDVCFVVVLNGAFVFAADLVKKVAKCHISFVKIASYEGITSQAIKETYPLTDNLTNKNVIIVEDIIETGQTIDYLIEQINEMKPRSLEVCTLLYKPQKFRCNYRVDYVGMEIEDNFVVGYGMDYQQEGRYLEDIYQLNDNN